MAHPPDTALDAIVVPPLRELGDGFHVRRALPSPKRRMVGPFVFLDQMGPHTFPAGSGLDVRPHPHIGLATVTYLLQGEIIHRDSLGSVQAIRPGELNWMSAGRSIVHSERTAPAARQVPSPLSGLQCWVALPQANEDDTPSFAHFAASQLPAIDGEGVSARVVAGDCFGRRSPAPTLWPLFFVDVQLQPGARLEVPAQYRERAVYVVDGSLGIASEGPFDAGRLLVLTPGAGVMLTGMGPSPTRLMLLGGEPMDGPRYLAWNFVASSLDRIEQAKQDWRDGRFAPVPGETEFIPLPELPGRPVSYP